MVAFHAQQSIEQSLKAFIEETSKHLPKTHDLLRLHKLSEMKLSDEQIEIIEQLNDLYLNARYPGELGLLPEGKPSPEDAELFRHIAQQLHALVISSCPE